MNIQEYKYTNETPSLNILSKIHYAVSDQLNVIQKHLVDDFYTTEDEIREYEEMVNYCELQKREATIACLEEIQDSVILYLDQNLNCYWRHGHHGISCCRCNTCGYEDWIKHCHPENVRRRSSRSSSSNSISLDHKKATKIDGRFYLENSHHREVWNTCIEACGFPELKVSAASRVSLQNN